MAATAPTATLKSAMVAADLSTEYRVFLVPSSTSASRVNHTLPGCHKSRLCSYRKLGMGRGA